MKKSLFFTFIVFWNYFLFTNLSLAAKYKYEGGTVFNGGSVSGVVHFEGKAEPIIKDLAKEKNKEFCSKHPDNSGMIRKIQKIRTHEGKLEGAVIFIENLAKGKEWKPESRKVEFKACDIFPKVFTVRKTNKGEKEGNLIITNQDENTLHNPHGYDVLGANRKTLFNKPLPSVGASADVTKNLKRLKKKKSKHFFLQCDQHNFMEADARVVWNPYYQVTDSDGAFKLTDVPAGKYKLVAWHPYAGQATGKIEIFEGMESKGDFKFKSGGYAIFDRAAPASPRRGGGGVVTVSGLNSGSGTNNETVSNSFQVLKDSNGSNCKDICKEFDKETVQVTCANIAWIDNCDCYPQVCTDRDAVE